jgi:hypothetical protein
MSQDPTDADLRAALAKSEAIKADFAKLWPALEQRFKMHASLAVGSDDVFAAKEVAWAAFRAGRTGRP